jgi:hypothetical protein
MVNVTAEPPLLPLVPPDVMVAAIPSTFTVRAWLAMKPWARIVTPVVPTTPLEGLRPLAEEFTVKLVAEVAVLAEASVTTTGCAPWGTVGMAKVTVDAPLTLVVPPAVTVAAVPPTVTVRVDPAAKPWASTEAEDPTVPETGLRLLAEAATVKPVGEVAEFVPSETTTLPEPLVAAGMVKVTVEAPLAPEVPPEVIVAAVPFTFTVRA